MLWDILKLQGAISSPTVQKILICDDTASVYDDCQLSEEMGKAD